jgi:hypothetical protein
MTLPDLLLGHDSTPQQQLAVAPAMARTVASQLSQQHDTREWASVGLNSPLHWLSRDRGGLEPLPPCGSVFVPRSICLMTRTICNCCCPLGVSQRSFNSAAAAAVQTSTSSSADSSSSSSSSSSSGRKGAKWRQHQYEKRLHAYKARLPRAQK